MPGLFETIGEYAGKIKEHIENKYQENVEKPKYLGTSNTPLPPEENPKPMYGIFGEIPRKNPIRAEVEKLESPNVHIDMGGVHPAFETKTGWYPKENIEQVERDYQIYGKPKGITPWLWHGTANVESTHGKDAGLYGSNFYRDWQYLKPFIQEYKKSGDYREQTKDYGDWNQNKNEDYAVADKKGPTKWMNPFLDWFSQTHGNIDPHYMAYKLSEGLKSGNESIAARKYNNYDPAPREHIPALGRKFIADPWVSEMRKRVSYGKGG